MYLFQTMSSNPNSSATNVIGFAPSAINDGATGTINCAGNTVDNQSGLTIAAKYYIQNDGTLGLSSAGKLSGGIALSSSKLLINVEAF